MNDEKKGRTLGFSIVAGSMIGTVLGVVIGAVTDNIGFWMAIGISLGTGMGVSIGAVLIASAEEKSDDDAGDALNHLLDDDPSEK